MLPRWENFCTNTITGPVEIKDAEEQKSIKSWYKTIYQKRQYSGIHFAMI